jgi:hypothetical protein
MSATRATLTDRHPLKDARDCLAVALAAEESGRDLLATDQVERAVLLLQKWVHTRMEEVGVEPSQCP